VYFYWWLNSIDFKGLKCANKWSHIQIYFIHSIIFYCIYIKIYQRTWVSNTKSVKVRMRFPKTILAALILKKISIITLVTTKVFSINTANKTNNQNQFINWRKFKINRTMKSIFKSERGTPKLKIIRNLQIVSLWKDKKN
jgi:hypothetical protein